MFDAEGKINSCNRSAEALFGYDGEPSCIAISASCSRRKAGRPCSTIWRAPGAPASPACSITAATCWASVRGGGMIPLSMTMGRTIANSPNFFAVFRDLSQSRKSEGELEQAGAASRAAGAKADMLARISHEVRMPLNAIIGFADVMIGERFGALGNERTANT